MRIDLAEAAAAGNQWIDAAALGRNDAAIGYGRLRLVIDHLMQRAEAFPKRAQNVVCAEFCNYGGFHRVKRVHGQNACF